MSYTFSRRDFFKYSAAAAVAVAGMGLLGGCSTSDPYNLYATKLGVSISLLQVKGKLKTEKDGTKIDEGVFVFEVTNGRTNPLILSPENFSVIVTTVEEKKDETTDKTTQVTGYKYYSLTNGDLQISGAANNIVYKNQTATFTITAPNFPTLKQDDTVILKYMPITTSVYTSYSMSWRITKEEDTDSDSGSDTGSTT